MSRRRLGSVKESEPGVWRLQWSEGYDPLTGKRRRPTKTFYGDERGAEIELARMVAQAGRHSTSALSLWEFIDSMYLPAIEPPELRRRTVDEYRRKLEKYVKGSPLASVQMDKLTRYSFVSWMRGVKQAVPNKQTQLHVYRALSAALGRAVMWGLLDENLLTVAVQPPEPDEHKPVILTEDQANAYLDAFEGHELEPIVVAQIAGALRPSEVLGLEWGDVDFDAGTLTVERGIHQRKGEVWTEPAKSRESNREIIMPTWAVAAMKPHRGIGRLIGTLTPEQARWRYRRHVEASGLPWCPMENLRHTAAMITVDRGVSWDDAAHRMGHTSSKMLKDRYAKRRLSRSQVVADALEGMRVAK